MSTLWSWRDGHGQQQYSGMSVAFKQCSIGTKGPKCAKKISPTLLHPHQQPEPLILCRMDSCFHVVYTKFWPYTTWMSQQKLRPIRPGNLLLKPVWSLSSDLWHFHPQNCYSLDSFSFSDQIENHLNHISSPFWCSVWTSADRLEHVFMPKSIECISIYTIYV